MATAAPTERRVDVVIIGGALAGAATAILLLRKKPELKVLIVEKSAAFTRRVGEATVEVSAYFLCRVLGLTQYMNETQLVKQGMRFWFANEKTTTLAECAEIGGKYLSRIPAFQVDRSSLDEEVLRRARALGAEVLRPATVTSVTLNSGGEQAVSIRTGDSSMSVAARWVVDASGVAAMLARQNHWWQPNTEHPTTAVWARWTGVKDWDGEELAEKFPEWSMACHGVRGTATNHIVGPGWWAWVIPLKGGDVSIGVVFDQRLVDWPEGGGLGERLKDFLMKHPAGRELLSDAQVREGDIHWRKNLPYFSTTYAGDGFALVGDAAGFIDPFYSPGMDWIAFTASAATSLITAERNGEPVQPLVAQMNRRFVMSYRRWFTALYKDKYEYMAEFDLMRIGFMMDLGFYYMGVASQPFRRGAIALNEPVFCTPPALPFYLLIKTYNRRLAAIARRRRKLGKLGMHNVPRRKLIGGYTFGVASCWPIGKAMAGWLCLELTEGWKSWFTGTETEPRQSGAANLPMPKYGTVPLAAATSPPK
jgi:flavin-dependent dehydrogenase